MLHIYSKEINSFLNSLIGYIVISVFLTGLGLLVWIFPETSVLDYGYADLETLFSFSPYIFIFLVPAITMRMFAEEKKSGTLELILTKPVSGMSIIIGKFLSGLTLVIVALLPTGVYYYSMHSLGNPAGNIDSAEVMGSYLGLILLGGVFVSFGIFASSITRNQIVAFILGVFFCFVMYQGFSSISIMPGVEGNSLLIEQLGISYHYSSMSKGLIDSRDAVYFLTIIIIMIGSTNLVLKSKQWGS
ncbi:MAG TPA: gliding motility-associated ABC transporter permease subunit GldF [Cyclobacteriaceae bacterium]|jgi:ABC-2 type transport system permease protein